jgi:hypothetical protein
MSKPAKTTTKSKKAKKTTMTAKQYAQYLRYVNKKYPSSSSSKTSTSKTTTTSKAATLAGPCSPWFVSGGNDMAGTCTMTAVANSLLLATGRRACDEEILAFGEALSIAQAIELAGCRGLAGVRLAGAWPLAAPVPGCVVRLELDEGDHAALLAGAGLMVSWGALVPARGRAAEAWALDWNAGAGR